MILDIFFKIGLNLPKDIHRSHGFVEITTTAAATLTRPFAT